MQVACDTTGVCANMRAGSCVYVHVCMCVRLKYDYMYIMTGSYCMVYCKSV